MRTIRFLFLLALACPVFADEPVTADQMWQHILQLTRTQATGQQEMERLTQLESETDMFWQQFAENPHVWESKLMLLQTRIERAAMEGKKPDSRTVEADVKEITDAKRAPLGVRAEAAYVLFEFNFASLNDPARLPAFDAAAAEFGRQYANSAQAAQIAMERIETYERLSPAKVDAVLKEYSESANPRIAMEAKRQISKKELTKKPLDMKFTAVDGKDFDLQKWRGKVVLVDFWATWCGPCRVELPRVIDAYKKHHEKGFEIVGVSLDTNKDKLVAFTKEKEMAWPQYFDGKQWDNKLSSAYGITGIPTMWLVDKKGYVRLTNARDDLDGNITKLLAE